MKFIFKILGGFFLFGMLTIGYLFFLGTADLRTELAKNSENKEKADELFNRMAEAHQIENWFDVQTYTVQMEDKFFGEMGNFSSPYPEDTVQFLANYIPRTFDGRLQFITGQQTGLVWGIQSWKTYVNHPTKGLKFVEKDAISFWLPTYQYFIEFPLRITKADARNYAGQKMINGKNCEGLLISWNTTAPQRNIDQYLVWLDPETYLIVKLEYTIREMYNFLKGAVYFEDYQDYEGIILPASMPVESNLLAEGFLHEMRLMNFIKNPLEVKELRPNRALLPLGDSKPNRVKD